MPGHRLQWRKHEPLGVVEADREPMPLCADGSWIPVKTLAIQIRVFCAASRPGDAGERAAATPRQFIGHVIQTRRRWWSWAAAA
jgi:hypothetical protein